MGHDVYPDVSNQDDGSDGEVQRRFRALQFPLEFHVCSTITEKCWSQAYSSAVEVAQDIETIEKEGIHKEIVWRKTKAVSCEAKVATHEMIPDGSVVQAMGENMPSVSNSRCMFC